jgi:hypothetical protein
MIGSGGPVFGSPTQVRGSGVANDRGEVQAEEQARHDTAGPVRRKAPTCVRRRSELSCRAGRP